MRTRAVGWGALVATAALVAACGLPAGNPPNLTEVPDTEQNDTEGAAQLLPPVGGLTGVRITDGAVNQADPDFFRVPLSSLSPTHQVRVTCEDYISTSLTWTISEPGGSSVASGTCFDGPIIGTVSGDEAILRITYVGASQPPYQAVVAAS